MMRNRSRETLPYLILMLGVISTSSGAIFVRLTQEQEVDSLVIAAYRLSIAVLILLPIIIFRHRANLRCLPLAAYRSTALAGIFLAIHFGTWILSLKYTSIASSVVLVSTTPIWVNLYSGLIKKEHVSSRMIVGLVLALVGGMVVSSNEVCSMSAGRFLCSALSSQGSNPLLGNLLALIGAFMAAGYLIVGRQVRSQIPITPYIFLVYGVGAFVLVCGCTLFGKPLLSVPTSSYLWLLCLAVIPQLIGHTSYNWALKQFPATYVSMILQAEPVGATILGVILFSEIPSLLTIAGGLMILIGITLVSREQVDTSEAELS
jgi:drug/metabolite transporter (DMT)-like permease